MGNLRAFHFTNSKLRDGSPVPPIGEWLEHKGELVMCSSGLHASVHPFDALQYAPGPHLHRVEVAGTIIKGNDKLVASRRKIIATIDAGPLLREFARLCALDVIHLWDAPAVVKEYLETGNEDLRAAARDAAGAAARAAARDAAWDAAGAAARAAARDAAWDAAWVARAAARAAARDAAWDAAGAAARDAARDAAWDAAWDAARDAQRKRLLSLVTKAFEGPLVANAL